MNDSKISYINIRIKHTLVILFLFLTISNAYSQDNHLLFSNILNKYVNNGKVNYKGLLSENSLDHYLSQLSSTNPDTIKSSNDKLAFWINTYNAYTLKIILDNYPLESINDLHSGGLILGSVFSTTIWDKEFIIINSNSTTLNSIEHEIIRKDFKEPRAHFALVCASISCPPLRNEAYEGYKLDSQLTDQGIIFINDTAKNKLDFTNKEASISKIFDWFEEDFGEDDEEILLFLAQFIDESIANDIKNNVTDWDIEYLEYNWNLNE